MKKRILDKNARFKCQSYFLCVWNAVARLFYVCLHYIPDKSDFDQGKTKVHASSVLYMAGRQMDAI